MGRAQYDHIRNSLHLAIRITRCSVEINDDGVMWVGWVERDRGSGRDLFHGTTAAEHVSLQGRLLSR
jgi:hypothetical protein